MVENIVGKGENAGYQHFLLLPQCFQRVSFSGSLKVGIVWYRVNPFPNKPWFIRFCSVGLLKTLWEKEKLLVMNNFSFSHGVFTSYGELPSIFKFENVVCNFFPFGIVKILLFGNGLIQNDEFGAP